MKKVLMLGTGGTIASEVTPSGLAPALTSAELLRCVPEISSLCSVTCEELFSIDSTNVTPAHWLTIARAIRAHYEEYDGFVIAHGTDTMAYTAAALSYLIQYSPKPIILTGAQKPIVFENTDSKTNLADAFRCAVSDLRGVMIVFNGRVILGTRARKTRTVSLQAFSSINYPELAVLQNGFLMEYIRPSALPAPVFYDKLGERVALMKMIPGADCGMLSYLLEHNDAVIIESFGVALIATYHDPDVLIPVNTVNFNEIRIVGSKANPNVSEEVLNFFSTGAIQGEKLITHTFPLEEYEKAVDIFEHKKENSIKVVIHP